MNFFLFLNEKCVQSFIFCKTKLCQDKKILYIMQKDLKSEVLHYITAKTKIIISVFISFQIVSRVSFFRPS